MITIFEQGGKPCFRVRVQPRASNLAITGCWHEALRVRLTAPPVADRANRQLVELLASSLDISRSSIRLLAGRGSRLKTVQVLTLSENELKSRLTPYLV